MVSSAFQAESPSFGQSSLHQPQYVWERDLVKNPSSSTLVGHQDYKSNQWLRYDIIWFPKITIPSWSKHWLYSPENINSSGTMKGKTQGLSTSGFQGPLRCNKSSICQQFEETILTSLSYNWDDCGTARLDLRSTFHLLFSHFEIPSLQNLISCEWWTRYLLSQNNNSVLIIHQVYQHWWCICHLWLSVETQDDHCEWHLAVVYILQDCQDTALLLVLSC